MGNLTRDPEYKQLTSGQAVCRLGVASNRQSKNRQTGQLTQEVCFVDVDVWGVQAESCNQYLKKGRAVLIEGRLKFDSWQEADGQRRSKHSVVADRVTFLAQAGGEEGSLDQEQEGEQPVVPSVALSPKAQAQKVVESSPEPLSSVSASGETLGVIHYLAPT